MMQNPDMLRQMMDNPMVQSLMSNPEVMRQMITSNPQMRELMEVRQQYLFYLLFFYDVKTEFSLNGNCLFVVSIIYT